MMILVLWMMMMMGMGMDVIEIEDDEVMVVESDDLSVIVMGVEMVLETFGEVEEAKASEAKRLVSEVFVCEVWEEVIERYMEVLMIVLLVLMYVKWVECFIKL